MSKIDRSPTTHRIISVGLTVFGGAVLWIAYTGDIPLITYTGEIPDGPIALIVGAICLFGGLYGIYDPKATIASKGNSGGGGLP